MVVPKQNASNSQKVSERRWYVRIVIPAVTIVALIQKHFHVQSPKVVSVDSAMSQDILIVIQHVKISKSWAHHPSTSVLKVLNDDGEQLDVSVVSILVAIIGCRDINVVKIFFVLPDKIKGDHKTRFRITNRLYYLIHTIYVLSDLYAVFP